MRSKFLAGAAAFAVTAATILATAGPASAQRWHRALGWGVAGAAAGVVGGVAAAATAPWWAPGYYGGYSGYAYAPGYAAYGGPAYYGGPGYYGYRQWGGATSDYTHMDRDLVGTR